METPNKEMMSLADDAAVALWDLHSLYFDWDSVQSLDQINEVLEKVNKVKRNLDLLLAEASHAANIIAYKDEPTSKLAELARRFHAAGNGCDESMAYEIEDVIAERQEG